MISPTQIKHAANHRIKNVTSILIILMSVTKRLEL